MTKVSASHILIMHNESRDSRSAITKDEALKRIIEIKDQYINGKKDFKELAVHNSDCSSGKSGGLSGRTPCSFRPSSLAPAQLLHLHFHQSHSP